MLTQAPAKAKSNDIASCPVCLEVFLSKRTRSIMVRRGNLDGVVRPYEPPSITSVDNGLAWLILQVLGCQHGYHKQCLSEYVLSKLGQYELEMQCPSCPRLLTDVEVRSLLDTKGIKAYEKASLDKAVSFACGGVSVPCPGVVGQWC